MTEEVDAGRRHFLTVATVATGAVGAAFVAVPFLASWKPSARAKAMGAPVEVDISKLEPGAMLKVEWRGKAIYIVHRTPQMLAQLDGVVGELRDPESARVRPARIRQERGARAEARIPGARRRLHAPRLRAARQVQPRATSRSAPDWQGGFFCPCHGSKFDMSGRVFKNVPAPTNLPVPPYQFVTDTRILIGAEKGNA